MKGFLTGVCIFCALVVISSGCINTNKKITVTDTKGNSFTLSEDQIDINVVELEKDGYTVQVESVTDEE